MRPLWKLRSEKLGFPRPLAVGIVNVTDDSFYPGARSVTADQAVLDGVRLAREGFDLIDVGAVAAQSGPPVPPGREAARLVPAIEGLASERGVRVTADTFSPAVARARAARRRRGDQRHRRRVDPEMLELVAEAGCGLVVMHIEGRPREDREPRCARRPGRASQGAGSRSASRRRARGVSEDQIALDPGLDFDLTVDDDLEILRRLERAARARQAAVRVAVAQGLPRRRAGRLVGGARAGQRPRVGDGRRDRARRRVRRRAAAPPRPSALDAMRVAAPDRAWLAAPAPQPARGAVERRRGRRRSSPAARTGGWSPRASRASAAAARRDSRAPSTRCSPTPCAGRDRVALLAPGRGARDGGGRSDIVTPAARRAASRCRFNLPVLDGIARDPQAPRALPLPDQGAGPGPGAQALGARPARAAPRDLRRRHAEGRPRRRSAALQPRAHQPRHGQRGLLPHHKHWGDFLANLRWVVVDEAHTYRGVFGSHVANVLRRLRRVARLYGANRGSCCASATIANPVELAERLVGTSFELVDSDGAPKAARRIAMWNPPLIDERREPGARRCRRPPTCSPG